MIRKPDATVAASCEEKVTLPEVLSLAGPSGYGALTSALTCDDVCNRGDDANYQDGHDVQRHEKNCAGNYRNAQPSISWVRDAE